MTVTITHTGPRSGVRQTWFWPPQSGLRSQGALRMAGRDIVTCKGSKMSVGMTGLEPQWSLGRAGLSWRSQEVPDGPEGAGRGPCLEVMARPRGWDACTSPPDLALPRL